ncbi:MAG: hypothetical protein ACREHF_02105 [Rhizomicrobium sp.]
MKPVRFCLALFAASILLAPAFGAQVISGGGKIFGGAGHNIFVSQRGGDTYSSPPGSTNRYVYMSESESVAGETGGHPLFDRIEAFYPKDVIDLSEICRGRCTGPTFTRTLTGLTDPRAIYFTWLPDGNGGYSTIVCRYPCRGGYLWIVLENGELALTPANFDLGEN